MISICGLFVFHIFGMLTKKLRLTAQCEHDVSSSLHHGVQLLELHLVDLDQRQDNFSGYHAVHKEEIHYFIGSLNP